MAVTVKFYCDGIALPEATFNSREKAEESVKKDIEKYTARLKEAGFVLENKFYRDNKKTVYVFINYETLEVKGIGYTLIDCLDEQDADGYGLYVGDWVIPTWARAMPSDEREKHTFVICYESRTGYYLWNCGTQVKVNGIDWSGFVRVDNR